MGNILNKLNCFGYGRKPSENDEEVGVPSKRQLISDYNS